jgi:hypothetical protein
VLEPMRINMELRRRIVKTKIRFPITIASSIYIYDSSRSPGLVRVLQYLSPVVLLLLFLFHGMKAIRI